MTNPDNLISGQITENSKPIPIAIESAKQLMLETATPEKLQEFLTRKQEQQLTPAELIEFLHSKLVEQKMQRKRLELIETGTLSGEKPEEDKHTLICNTMAIVGLEATRFLELRGPQDRALFPEKSDEEVQKIFKMTSLLQFFFHTTFAKELRSHLFRE